MELYPLTMCYFIERTQKCTKLFFNHYLAVQDIENFLRNHPNADTFIPNKNCNYDADKLLYFITLLHNGRKNEVVQAIKELKAKGHSCQFCDWASGMDSYDFILKWCKG